MTVIIPAWSRDALKLADTPTVKLAQLFTNNDLAVELLLLQPLPWLRYQLQTTQLAHLPWWNVFDDLQGVREREGLPLGLEDLDLPPQTQFAYLDNTVLLLQNGQIQGRVHFHPAGFVGWLETTEADGKRRVKVYDDRGFCSTETLYSTSGNRLEKLWFAPDTHPVMHQGSGLEIDCLDNNGTTIKTYPTLEALITEHVQRHLANRSDLVISAANPATAPILTQLAQHHRLAYLLATQLAPTLPDDLFSAVERVIVPTSQMARRFKEVNANLDTPVDVISPYATTLALGNSTELPETTLTWAVNHVTRDAQRVVGQQLIDWLAKDDQNRLVAIATSTASVHTLAAQLQQQVLDQLGITAESPLAQLVQSLLNQLAANQTLTQLDDLPENVQTALQRLQRIRVVSHLTDRAREEVLGASRLLIDLGAMPDLQLQIAAISAGIPQINHTATGYVADHENGLIIVHPSDLTAALDYYLGTLIHWNESLVLSINYLESLAEPKLLEYWRGVIKNGEHA